MLSIFIEIATGTNGQASSLNSLMERAHSSPVYALSTNDWLRFPFSTFTSQAKVLTYADLPIDTPWNADQKWTYKIQVQVLNKDGAVLESRDLEYKSTFYLYRSQNLGVFSPSFYLEKDAQPTQSLPTILNWQDLGKAALVRVRLLSKDKDIKTVFCRVYEPANITFNLRSFWEYLSPDDQERLAGGNLFDLPHLSSQEKKNLVRNLWKPIGPEGIPHETFQERTLYEIEPEGEPIIKPIPPVGMYVDANHQVAIPIPESGMQLRFQLTPFEKKATQSSFSLDSQLYSRKITDPQTNHFLTNKDGTFTHTFEKGILFVSTQTPAILRVFNSNGVEIVLEPASVKGYKLEKGESLEYKVIHDDKHPTPFRLDIRKLLSTPVKDIKAQSISYEMLDEHDTVIKSGSYTPIIIPSLYDRVAKDPTMILSDSDKIYFVLSENVKKIRFSSKASFLLTAYNRPPELPRTYNIPDDYYTYQSPDESLRRSWFYLQPVSADLLDQKGYNILLLSQPKPVEIDEIMLSGVYEWEELFPDGPWTSLYAFIPKDEHAPRPSQAQHVTYSPLPRTGTKDIEFKGLAGVKTIRPKLVYFKTSESPELLTLRVDGKTLLDENILGTQGEIELSPLSIGKHIVNINSPSNVKFFISHAVEKSNLYLKRQLISVKKGKTKFTYDKKDKATVILTLYVFGTPQQQNKITFNIKGPSSAENTPFPDYSIRTKIYNVHFLGDPISFLSPHKETYIPSEPIFIKLGEDLSPGTYSLTLETSEPAYVLLSQLTPGLHNKRGIVLEIQE